MNSFHGHPECNAVHEFPFRPLFDFLKLEGYDWSFSRVIGDAEGLVLLLESERLLIKIGLCSYFELWAK